jgi:hypothetical protein
MAHKKKRRGRAATGKGRKASKANKLNGNWHCEVCVICLDEPMAKARARGLAGVCQPCGHDAFHLECLAKALAVHAACPVCRDAKAVALPLPPHTRGPAHIAQLKEAARAARRTQAQAERAEARRVALQQVAGREAELGSAVYRTWYAGQRVSTPKLDDTGLRAALDALGMRSVELSADLRTALESSEAFLTGFRARARP